MKTKEKIYPYSWFNENFAKLYEESKGKMELVIRNVSGLKYYSYRGPGWKTQEWLMSELTGR